MALSSFPASPPSCSITSFPSNVNTPVLMWRRSRRCMHAKRKGKAVLNRPLASDLYAISVSDRLRYDELRRMVATAIIGQRELRDCIVVQIGTERPCAPY